MITLRDIIQIYNFRDTLDNQIGMYHDNTLTIRIYYDTFDWFEFGVYDFGDQDDRDKRVKHVLTKEVLDAEVSSIRCVDEVGILEVHLKE